MSVDIRSLSKRYKKVRAVDNLSLTIKTGELFALLGLNGAGKTTTIKMLSCLLVPTSGDAFLLGKSIISDRQAVKQLVNLSPQETAVAPNLSVRENLELIARIYGCGKKASAREALEIMSELGLSERANDKSRFLSGGMQRRLSIAMALISNPEILFLDEPTLGLDVLARHDMWDLLFTLKGKVTVILTTHYLEEAEALSDRIGIMCDGKLKAVGTAEQLKQQTQTASFEAAFLKLTGRGDRSR